MKKTFLTICVASLLIGSLHGSDFQIKTIKNADDLPEEFCTIWKPGDILISDGRYLVLLGGVPRPLDSWLLNYPNSNAMGSIIGFAPVGEDVVSDLSIGSPVIKILERRDYLSYSSVKPVKGQRKGAITFKASASYEGKKQPSGTYFIDTVLANASKIHEGKEMAEAIRLMVDISGGYVADLPSDKDLDNPEVGHLLKKYLKGNKEVPVESRIKMFRLVEKMAMESADTISDIHGGGSPEAHRVTIFRETDLEAKKRAAKRLAGIDED